MRENSGRANTKDGELMMKNANMPAMPCGESYKTQQPYGGDWVECKKGALYNGLTKREMFAMHIMAGFSVDPDISEEMASEAAKGAVMLADALLAELEVQK